MLNAADILILAVLALSMLVGLWRGLVGEVLSLATWVAAFWVAWAFGQRVGTWYAQWLSEPAASAVAGYLTCFLGVLIVGALVAFGARRLLGAGGLRGGDRALGALFGLARGLLLVMFAVMVLGTTAVPRDAGWWRTSSLLPPFEAGAHWLAAQLPPDVDRGLDRAREGLRAAPRVPISGLRDTLAPLALPGTARSTGAPTVLAPGHRPLHVRQRNDVGQ